MEGSNEEPIVSLPSVRLAVKVGAGVPHSVALCGVRLEKKKLFQSIDSFFFFFFAKHVTAAVGALNASPIDDEQWLAATHESGTKLPLIVNEIYIIIF